MSKSTKNAKRLARNKARRLARQLKRDTLLLGRDDNRPDLPQLAALSRYCVGIRLTSRDVDKQNAYLSFAVKLARVVGAQKRLAERLAHLSSY